MYLLFFFFNDPATTEIYTLSLHDALPILVLKVKLHTYQVLSRQRVLSRLPKTADELYSLALPLLSALEVEFGGGEKRSEEHTSELQSRPHLVCRLLLEKKKKISQILYSSTYS